MKLKHIAFLSLILCLYGCKTVEVKAEQLATIRDGANVAGFQTCGWVIQFDNEFSSIVVPVDLDPAFQQDGLKVEVILTNSTQLATCRRDSPPMVEVVFIREIESN
ncbi:hypothetical protein [Roseivirga misakiensis]|uniref:Uncharacterized protein n=1 Tax=Roseivirga misakiensis TaxID=1563681 RepID=A0A1E5T6E6_9BACT|nr:hypothetical protein [Roseivirga misakiensis]OEK06918.1 hypothetical protein BFP71_04485 [Roseivirga misakiensis]